MRVYDHLYIDISNLYAKFHYGYIPKEIRRRGRVIALQGLVGFIHWLDEFEGVFRKRDGKTFYCLDNFSSRVTMRKIYDSSYKENRKLHNPAFYEGMKLLALVLKNYSDTGYLCQYRGLEADDLVEALIELEPASSHLVVSADLDWSRSMSTDPVVDWHDGREIVTRAMFMRRYGFEPTPSHIINYKVLRGDKVDNIPPGVKGLPTPLVNLLIDYKNVGAMLDDLEEIDFLSKAWKTKIKAGRDQLMLNHKLVSFIPPDPALLRRSIRQCEFDPVSLGKIAQALEVNVGKLTPPPVEVSSKNFFL